MNKELTTEEKEYILYILDKYMIEDKISESIINKISDLNPYSMGETIK